MKKSEIIKQCVGWKKGTRLQFTTGPQAGTIFEITKEDRRDGDGFEAVEITFNTGEIEICPIEILNQMIDEEFEHTPKFI